MEVINELNMDELEGVVGGQVSVEHDSIGSSLFIKLDEGDNATTEVEAVLNQGIEALGMCFTIEEGSKAKVRTAAAKMDATGYRRCRVTYSANLFTRTVTIINCEVQPN